MGSLGVFSEEANGWCTGTCLESVCFFTTIGNFKYLYSALHSQGATRLLLGYQTMRSTSSLNHILCLAAAPRSLSLLATKNPQVRIKHQSRQFHLSHITTSVACRPDQAKFTASHGQLFRPTSLRPISLCLTSSFIASTSVTLTSPSSLLSLLIADNVKSRNAN